MKIVTFDFFLKQTKTQDLENGRHKLVRPGPNLVFSCNTAATVQTFSCIDLLQRKTRLMIGFVRKWRRPGKSLPEWAGPIRFPAARVPRSWFEKIQKSTRQNLRRPVVWRDRWNDLVSSATNQDPLVVAGSGRVEAGPFSRNLANEKFTYDTKTPTPTTPPETN
jgi:hypothetical protein